MRELLRIMEEKKAGPITILYAEKLGTTDQLRPRKK